MFYLVASISTPTLRRLRQKVCEFKASVSYVSQCPVSPGYCVRFCLKGKKIHFVSYLGLFLLLVYVFICINWM